MLAFRMRSVSEKIAEAAYIRAVDETSIRVEPSGDVPIQGVELDPARAPFSKNLIRGTRLMRSVAELGFAGNGLRVHLPVLVDLDMSIKTTNAVEAHLAARRGASTERAGLQFAVGINEPDAAALSDLAVQTKDTEERIMA